MQSRVVHFIGIGGIGMSGIAKILLEQGFHVQGTDVKSSEITLSLGRLGAKIFIGHDARYLEGVDLVVYSSSIPASHPERVWAVKKKIRVIHRAQALADLCYGKYTIAVTGTHGKTTTTSMIGTILKEAGRDPSIVVGGCVKTFGGNASLGKGKEIVIEADESDSSFLKFSPDLEVVTNIEEEHMDHFPNIEAIESAYRNFINRLSRDGAWFGCLEDPGVLKLANEKVKSFYGYGFDPLKHAIAATGIVECPNGHRAVAFKVWYLGQELGSIEMKVIGRHNVLNALAATGVALKLGIAFAAVQQALSHYESAGRRFDVKYEDEQSLVVDDYAHHPTEIQKTLTAARGLHKKRIVAIFQPHRYSRVKALLSQFGNSFKNADKLIVTDIYAAGEALRANISGARVCQVIQSAGHPDAVFIERARVKEYVQSQIERGDLVITLGAGDIGQVAGQLAEFLKNQNSPGHKRPHPFWSVKGSVLLNEPLFKHTSLKVGGPVD
ncbi:MAG: UDP-N-acetylmuramate--L-alanine ligase, partial [Candidatus Omnitrophica bacterium CG1_02_46_14]